MLKSIWIYVVAIAALGVGGWYYYERHHTVVTVQAQQPLPNVAPQNASDDETNKKRQEGIGSIGDLKPVPIGPAPSKSDGK